MSTTFKGPVISKQGFQGGNTIIDGDLTVTGTITGDGIGGGGPVTGDPNTFAAFNGDGDLETLPGWTVGADNAANVSLQIPINNLNRAINTFNSQVSIESASPAAVITGFDIYTNLDTTSSGLNMGTNGQAAVGLQVGVRHAGTSPSGALTATTNYLELGNGTNAVTASSLSFINAYGTIRANATVTNSVFGYNFSPTFETGSDIVDAYTNVFVDATNLQSIESGAWTSFSASPQIGDMADNKPFMGLQVSPTVVEHLGGSSFFGVNVAPQIDKINTGVFKGINVSPTITDSTDAIGAFIDMTNVTASGQKLGLQVIGDVEIQGALSFSGSLSIGQLNAYYGSNPVNGGGNPTTLHGLVSAMTALNGQTVANADTIGVNTAMLVTLQANSTTTSGPFGLGFSALVLPCVVETHTGSTLDNMSGAAFAINLSGSSTGGTIDTIKLARSVAVPNGITTVNKLRGFQFDLPFGDPGTTTHGVYIAPAVHNYLAGALKIGGATDTELSGTTLHVEGDSYFDGDIGFFATTPVSQQVGGASTAGGTYTSTEQTMIQTMWDALRAYGLLS